MGGATGATPSALCFTFSTTSAGSAEAGLGGGEAQLEPSVLAPHRHLRASCGVPFPAAGSTTKRAADARTSALAGTST